MSYKINFKYNKQSGNIDLQDTIFLNGGIVMRVIKKTILDNDKVSLTIKFNCFCGYEEKWLSRKRNFIVKSEKDTLDLSFITPSSVKSGNYDSDSEES